MNIVKHLGGAEISVPVENIAVKTPDGLKAPALGLAVRTRGLPAEGDWRTSWLVERQPIPARKKGASRVVVASRALLAWQEGAIENRVSAFHLPAQPTSKEQLSLLTWLAGQPVRRGKVKLPGGKQGNWVMARGKQQGKIVFAITWGRPSESGFYIQYVALRSQDNPGKNGWKPALLDLASRFDSIE